MCERRISGSTWSTQIVKTGRSATAKCNMRRSDMQRTTASRAKRGSFEKKSIRKERSMPTYVCYLPRDRFSPDQKRQIVDAITFRHSEATGAPSYFVQVVIEEAERIAIWGANIRLITSGSAVIYVPVAPRNSGLA